MPFSVGRRPLLAALRFASMGRFPSCPGGSDGTQPADLDSAGRPRIDRRVSLTDERG